MTFSRAQSKIDAIKIKQEYAQTQARGAHPDMSVKHNDWIKDAQKNPPIYTVLNAKIKEEVMKEQLKVEKFRSKMHEK